MRGKLELRVNTKSLLEVNGTTSLMPSKESPWRSFVVLFPKLIATTDAVNEFEERYSTFGFEFTTGIMWHKSDYFWSFSISILGVGFKVSVQTGY
jgi:hypothetical protein